VSRPAPKTQLGEELVSTTNKLVGEGAGTHHILVERLDQLIVSKRVYKAVKDNPFFVLESKLKVAWETALDPDAVLVYSDHLGHILCNWFALLVESLNSVIFLHLGSTNDI